MAPISVTATVDAPRERVFDLLCDLGARPAWTGNFIDDFRLVREQPSGVGASARFRVDAPRGIRYMDTTITEAERPHLVAEQGFGGRSNRITLKSVWELTEGPGAVTTVSLTFAAEPRGLRGGRWWKRRWKRALHALAEVVESGERPPETVVVAGADRLPAA
jgi:uncharacterized protein YndB with AHSA1/START domain